MRVPAIRMPWASAVVCLVACGTSASVPSEYDFGDSGAPSMAASSGAGNAPPTKLTPTPVTGDCPPAAKLIYVTGEGAKLYSYDPEAGQFTKIGTLSCVSQPTHMTVDRQGNAWVAGSDDPTGSTPSNLYEASTTDASCTRVTTWSPHPGAFDDFALTFLGATSAPDPNLYLLGDPSADLGVFDTSSGGLTRVGEIAAPNAASAGGDMTTNGDGTLYFLEASSHQTLYDLDPSTGAILGSTPTGLDASESDQALAAYGGLFYDFLGSAVYTVDVATKAVKRIGTAPLEVTGAGESTCVPTTAPPPAGIK